MRATPANLEQIFRDFDRIREKVEKFTGERGDATKSLSALRRGELAKLASLKLNSSQVAAAPTQAEFNALQKDVSLIFNILARLANTDGQTDIPKV
jgi:hypothetical protein